MKHKALAIPYVVWMALFVVAPIIMVVIYAFSTAGGGFTLDNFTRMGTYTVIFTRSFQLALIATLVCLIIGYPLSYIMAREGPRAQRVGMMLIMLSAVDLQWLPPGGADEGLRSLLLPAFTLGLFSAATICRLLRSNMIEVLGKEYIDVCKAKGLPARKVISKHALKNALSSILTMLGMQFASLLGGSVITETVFAWPGVGRLVIQSITTSDFAVVECVVFLMAVVFVVINFVVDILYCVINPRIRLQ